MFCLQLAFLPSFEVIILVQPVSNCIILTFRLFQYRNKLNEQQNQRLNQQREALTARQEEMSAIDKRISELQERLQRKRLLNQQLATQISAASHKAAYHQFVR